MKDAEEGLSFISDHDLNNDDLAGVGQYPIKDPSSENHGYPPSRDSYRTGGALSDIAFIRQSRHPVAAIFHLLFKSLALLVYIFCGIFTTNFIFVAVVTILLLAFDFWTVKNVTGRLLVGLRWWNYVREDGTNEWIFEALPQQQLEQVSGSDSRVFWVGLYAPLVVWGCLLFVDILKFNFQWLVVVCAAMAMTGANIVGYTKCSNDAGRKMSDLMQQGSAGLSVVSALGQNSAFQSAAFQSAFSGLLGAVSGGGNNSGAQSAGDFSVPVTV
mmetsp:Transcript_32303/g.59066  ORF Transcript_32303/g.59066 Transcript_32303/m.59066 type:complete len:271 (+) Transcript_32303:38-850(+)